MGRQSAGAAFIRALARSRPERVWCYSQSELEARALAQELAEHGASRTGVAWVPFLESQRLAEPGLLYRPDPGLWQDAWRRLAYATTSAYSLCGITHTTASHSVMEVLAGMPTAPLESWDALICTSRAVRDSVRVLVENQVEYLREKLGATRFSLPQLPVIPLGVHVDHFAPDADARGAARSALGLGAGEVAVLYAGRLSFHGKAHPAPMYLALEANAADSKLVLIQAGWFANEAIETAFKEDAEALCPSIRILYVDGRNQASLRQAFAAADIFTSLSDNIQETFGLTPVEAMAAGLPSIVSDWDGYRDTIREGIDGFRVPTLTLPPGAGRDLAERFDLGVDNYDHYCAYTSQLIAVDVPAAARAYGLLIRDPELRARMGAAAQERARAMFDWSVILRRYQNLWDELAEGRRSQPRLAPPLTPRRRSDRADPFAMFASYPTAVIGPQFLVRRCTGMNLEIALARRELHTVRSALPVLPSPHFLTSLLDRLPEGRLASADILAQETGLPVGAVARAVVWMSKLGVLEFAPGYRSN